MRFFLILFLATAIGFLSLSQEIVWVKIIASADQGRPTAFAHALGFFLLGIALGAFFGRRVQERQGLHPLSYIAGVLTLASVCFFFLLPVSSQVLTVSGGWGLGVLYLSVVWVSFLMGGIFPVLCHFGICSEGSVGMSIAWIYLANILGSTSGPIITGFVLMDIETIEHTILILSVMTLALAEIVWFAAPVLRKRRRVLLGGTVCLMAGMLFTQETVYHHFTEKIHFHTEYAPQGYRYSVQNRSGVVGVWAPNLLYGDGTYDGRFTIDPVQNANLITRAYFIPALSPKPGRVLQVGLGGGAWARVIADYPDVKSLKIVEINPAYIDMIWHFPDIASVLNNPKVTVYIDDGRRWLNRHPDEKFDVIVMNTTFHWRAHATNVLSGEFLHLCKAHLNPGGMIYFNTTDSNDAAYTAARVFQYVTPFMNFVAASDRPFAMSREDKRRNLLKFQQKGRPVFEGEAADVLEELLNVDTSDRARAIRHNPGLWYITDDNMAVEFKTNGPGLWWRSLVKRVYRPERAWSQVLF